MNGVFSEFTEIDLYLCLLEKDLDLTKRQVMVLTNALKSYRIYREKRKASIERVTAKLMTRAKETEDRISAAQAEISVLRAEMAKQEAELKRLDVIQKTIGNRLSAVSRTDKNMEDSGKTETP